MSKDYYKNERIELAREKVKNAESLEDIALIVTHEGLDLLSTTLENSMRRIMQEEIQKAAKEIALGLLKGMEPPKQLPAPKEPKKKPRYDYKEFEADLEKEEPEPEGTPMFNLWENQAQLAEEKKKRLAADRLSKRKSIPWSVEEDEDLLRQLEDWKATGISTNKALGRIHLPGRTPAAIKFRYTHKLKGEMNP